MNPRKASNLFEAIRTGRGRNEPQVRVPGWWNAPREQPPRNARGSTTTRPNGTVSVMAWLASPSRLAMPRALWLVVLAALVCLPIIAYRIGTSGQALTRSQADVQSSEKMADLRRTEVNTLLLSQLSPEQKGDHALATPGAAPGVAPANAQNPSGDPRTPGLNYFCLETMPERYRSEAERAAAFLRRNGVDVAIIPVNNARLQVIALRGFDRPYSDPQAQEYRNLLRSLGRAWKLEHQGWSDWADTYPAKYTGK